MGSNCVGGAWLPLLLWGRGVRLTHLDAIAIPLIISWEYYVVQVYEIGR